MAAMGIHGVMSYAVSQRERELGIRIALGADRGELTRMVAAQGANWVPARRATRVDPIATLRAE